MIDIEKYREKKNISQEKLAALIGMSRAGYLAAVKNNSLKPEVLQKLSKVLDIEFIINKNTIDIVTETGGGRSENSVGKPDNPETNSRLSDKEEMINILKQNTENQQKTIENQQKIIENQQKIIENQQDTINYLQGLLTKNENKLAECMAKLREYERREVPNFK